MNYRCSALIFSRQNPVSVLFKVFRVAFIKCFSSPNPCLHVVMLSRSKVATDCNICSDNYFPTWVVVNISIYFISPTSHNLFFHERICVFFRFFFSFLLEQYFFSRKDHEAEAQETSRLRSSWVNVVPLLPGAAAEAQVLWGMIVGVTEPLWEKHRSSFEMVVEIAVLGARGES